MNILRPAIAALLACCSLAAHAAEGLVAVKSPHSASETAARLVTAVQERGLKLFARIDYAAGAGTPLLECQQTTGIDLPLKALVWEDDAGQVWFGYNDPAWIAARHGAGSCPAVANLSKALSGLAAAATAP